LKPHPESHFTARAGWLRAAVLGANDGIVSTASLVVGVAAANSAEVLIAGVAAMVAGAMSMAAGEYVSVSSQADTENADIQRERQELATDPVFERKELARLYMARGLDTELADRVAERLMAHDALGAHMRDELGLHEGNRARPLQAALASAATFAGGALFPLLSAYLSPRACLIPVVAGTSLVCLALLGALAAWAGGSNVWRSTLRVTLWSALAMGLTAGVGRLFQV
jgi:VIT1/CCC1 family predicted Fe2+/Mn2+ transporter